MEQVFAVVDIGKEFPMITKFTTLGGLANVIIRNSFMIAGVISFIFLIFGGFSIIVGAGSRDTQQVEKGQKAITGAVIGLILVIASFWIIQIIETVTGIPILNPK